VPSVIHQDIDPRELLTRGGNNVRAIRLAGQIRRNICRLAMGGDDLFRSCREFRFRSRSKKNARSFLRE